ncbi:4'-phosphopantetheinyl transferase family protein [Streptomyces ficellus]|uniref:4'-phosphopantetheinyl transferase superfamily protein n=1 Tax=Streptomyces ficellus TaxID=1977088 RepID=A0A6I6FAK4_9ACTN|nr:4'-phosphopantetheinyl transferase superfamily protein [Streptomyces ficellus]QGV80121.1 4'-phosphopantetheinyl transferase superfamily protein [Streptomyces ficellus]
MGGGTAVPPQRTDAGAARGFLDLWMLHLPPWDQPSWDAPGPALDPVADVLLDREERARADAFLDPVDRLLHQAAHITLRRVLAAYTRCPPGEIAFVREPCHGCGGPHGRPVLAGARTPGDAPLHFSLSHTPGVVMVAVASERVGADVQLRPGHETVDVCTVSIHPAERAEVRRAGASGRCRVFGRIWARKEAYLKGLGTGLVRDPAADYLGDAEPARRPHGWSVLDVECGTRHDAAVAVRGDVHAPTSTRLLPVDVLSAGHRGPGRPRPAAGPATA